MSRTVECEACGARFQRTHSADIVECPKCGEEVFGDTGDLAPRARRPRSDIVTIQATAKSWKLLQAIGALMLIGATIWGCVGMQANPDGRSADAMVGPILVGFFGLVIFMVGRVGAWWCHE